MEVTRQFGAARHEIELTESEVELAIAEFISRKRPEFDLKVNWVKPKADAPMLTGIVFVAVGKRKTELEWERNNANIERPTSNVQH